jgi:dual specificity phosphatase 12
MPKGRRWGPSKISMDSITDKIWIGNYLDAQDRAALASAGIKSILSLDGSSDSSKAAELGVERIEVVELVDGAGNPPEKFLRAVRLVRELSAKHGPLLVHCHAGQSRSAAVVCKYFMQEEGNNLGQAMRRITSRRKVAIIAGLQEALDFK